MNGLIPENGSVLVKVPNWIGDAVLCTVGLSAIKHALPEVNIVALAKPWVKDVIVRHKALSEVIVYSPRRFPFRLIDFAAITSEVRRRSFSTYILFHKNFESALIGFVAGIPVRLGRPTDARERLLTHPLRLPDGLLRGHQVNHYIALAEFATGHVSVNCRPEVFLSENDRKTADEYYESLPPGGPIIPVSAGAAYGSAKCWPPERFAQFISCAVDKWNARIIFLGGPADKNVCEKIVGLSNRQSFCMAGTYPILVQAAVIERAGMCLANDSGLMHVAAALNGVTTVALFGPTVPEQTAPFGENHIVLHQKVPCWPCKHRICPLKHDCMMQISVDQVLNAVETALGKR